MKRHVQRVLILALACLMLLAPLNCYAAIQSEAPVLGGLKAETYTKTKDKFINILLLGIDYGYEYSDYISCKTDLNECHTDAIVLVSINKTQKTVNLISIPRDTISYVPGVRGIYKANAAVNCAENIEKGIEKTRQVVSWHLGGIEIHHYIAVDVPALIALGDAIGGIEYELEMSYTATSGHYQKGLQVLDGQGIMDYVRARKNAPIGGTDLGRTERQRKMLSAIFRKIKDHPTLLFKCIGVLFDKDVNIFTDIGFFSAVGIAPSALSLDFSRMETHVLEGKLQDFYSNFNFTDQDARKELLMDVFGIEAQETITNRQTRWLVNEGFEEAKVINLARMLLEDYRPGLFASAEAQTAYRELEAAYDLAAAAFQPAASTQEGDARNTLLRAKNDLKKLMEEAAPILGYSEKLSMKVNDPWYEDEYINEYQYNWN